MKKALLITLSISILVLIVWALANVTVQNLENTKPSAAQHSERALQNKQTQSQNTPTTHYSQQPDKDININFDALYPLSREYSRCLDLSKENFELISTTKQALNELIAKPDSVAEKLKVNAYLHSINYLDLPTMLAQIQITETLHAREQFKRLNWHNQDSVEPMFNEYLIQIGNLHAALNDHNLEEIRQAFQTLKANKDIQGVLATIRGESQLFNADVVIGHYMAEMSLAQIREILHVIPVTHLMFSQAIRSNSSLEQLALLLQYFEFQNTPVVTRHSHVRTALQTAIDFDRPEVLELLLQQPNIKHSQFDKSPINYIVLKAINNQQADFTENQKAMLEMATASGYRLQLINNKKTRQTELLGVIAGRINADLRKQLNEMQIPEVKISRLNFRNTPNIDDALRVSLDAYSETILLARQESTQLQEQCKGLRQQLDALMPPFNVIERLSEYLDPRLGFSKQIESLSRVSPVHVDAYIDLVDSLPIDEQKLAHLLDGIDNLPEQFKQVREQVNRLDLNVKERHSIAIKLCETFGRLGLEYAKEITHFIKLDDYSSLCLMEHGLYDDAFRDTYFSHPDTYPGQIYSLIVNHDVDAAIQQLTSRSSITTKQISGYPFGRDALMLALDRVNQNPLQLIVDYEKLVHQLLFVTPLNRQHFMRLHMLKIMHYNMFDKLAQHHPEIAEAPQYPLSLWVKQ